MHQLIRKPFVFSCTEFHALYSICIFFWYTFSLHTNSCTNAGMHACIHIYKHLHSMMNTYTYRHTRNTFIHSRNHTKSGSCAHSFKLLLCCSLCRQYYIQTSCVRAGTLVSQHCRPAMYLWKCVLVFVCVYEWISMYMHTYMGKLEQHCTQATSWTAYAQFFGSLSDK